MTTTKERSPQTCQSHEEHRTATSTEAIGEHIVDELRDACQDRMGAAKHMLDQLSAQNQETITTLIRQLAGREGIRVVYDAATLTTPAEAMKRWLTDLEFAGLSKHTISSYKAIVGKLLRRYPTPTEQDIKDYLLSALCEGIDTSSFEQVERRKNSLRTGLTIFRLFFRYLNQSGFWNEDPTRNLKLPKTAKRERRIPKLDDIQRLLTIDMSPRDRMMVQLLLDTGLRVEELATIRLTNIYLDKSRIVVLGKGRKERIVPISPSTIHLLKSYFQQLSQNADCLFPAGKCTSSNDYLHTHTFRRHLEALCKKAGISRITPHALRHLVATTLLERGADIKAVSLLLGHSDVMITLQVYHHVGRKAIEDMHERLGLFADETPRLPEGVA